MSAGLGAYRVVLADPRARAFSLAGFVARLPISMTGIGVVLLVSLVTGSFGRAGIITAAGTVVGAAAAPAWGRLVDRVGQARVLVVAALANSIGISLLVTSVLRGWPLVVSLMAAGVTGLGYTSAGACVRARWAHQLEGGSQLDTAFAVEAVLDEVIFIVGPVLVTFLATSLHPAAGLAATATIGLVGALLLAGQRSTQPPAGAARPVSVDEAGLRFRALLPVVVACWAIGTVFGGMEVVVVAFAQERGVLPYAGALLMAWALGSLSAGVVVGSRQIRMAPHRRFRIGAAALALSLVPLPFVDRPAVMALCLAASGIAIAPTMIALIAATQVSVPASRLTEALGWTSTGIAAGVATGAAVLGALIDRSGSMAGFWAEIGAGAVLILAALGVRGGQRGIEPPGTISPTPSGIAAAAHEHPEAQSR